MDADPGQAAGDAVSCFCTAADSKVSVRAEPSYLVTQHNRKSGTLRSQMAVTSDGFEAACEAYIAPFRSDSSKGEQAYTAQGA